MTEAVAALKARGFNSPYLRNFVVARVNPLRFIKGEPPPIDELLPSMTKRVKGMDVGKIKNEDVARTGGAAEARPNDGGPGRHSPMRTPGRRELTAWPMHHPVPVRDGRPESRRVSRMVVGAVALGLPPLRRRCPAGERTPHPRRTRPGCRSMARPRQMGDIQRVAATFRLINIDADPDAGNFTPAQIRQLKGGGRNTVITYLNIGSANGAGVTGAGRPAG